MVEAWEGLSHIRIRASGGRGSRPDPALQAEAGLLLVIMAGSTVSGHAWWGRGWMSGLG